MSVVKNASKDTDASALAYTLQTVAAVPRATDVPLARSDRLIPRRILADVVRMTDFLVTMLAGLAVAALSSYGMFAAHVSGHLVAVAATSVMLVFVLDRLGLYRVSGFASVVAQIPRVVLAWAVVLTALAASVYWFNLGDVFSRAWLPAWFAAGAACIIVERSLVACLVRYWTKTGRLYRRAVIYGGGANAVELVRAIEADAETDIRIFGVFDDRLSDRVSVQHQRYPTLGPLSALISMARSTRIDLVIIALPLSAQDRIVEVADELSQLPVDVKIPASFSQVRFSHGTYTRVGSIAMLNVAEKAMTGWGGVGKWLFDKITAGLSLLLLAPVMAAVAIAVKFDSRGPVLFRQKRYGFNNELIEVFKFRSMYTDMCDAAASKLVTKEDPRVTPVGRFIRKTSIDELPQLFNVLLGDLSLVGPRPHAVAAKAGEELYNDVVKSYFKRHKVKPGITGWAQINGWRGETDTREKIEKRVEFDLYYIENWSILFDIYILLKTPLALFKTENSY
jgi:Undecaprenyl-phosphate glucose phosphotransferase